MPKSTTILTTMFVLLSTQGLHAGPPSFTGLGDLPGGLILSLANDVSADGSTVVGLSFSNSTPALTAEAFRWTSDTGMVGLGHLDGANSFFVFSEANSISADGSTAVGYSLSTVVGVGVEAVRWTAGTGIESLNLNQPYSPDTHAEAISDDGTTIVGRRGDILDRSFAFRWTAETGAVDLGELPGNRFSVAYDVSANGSTIVGVSNSETVFEAFRWTSGEGMVGIGDLPGGDSYSKAFGVSADGSIIVGESVSDFGREAFRWTSDGGMIGLGDLPGGSYFSFANSVSADGSVIVGGGRTLLGEEAFLWDETNGMRNLKEVLTTDFGLDLTGWQLTEATAVSADGRTIVGNGTNPDGFEEAWIAVVPEPSTFTLAGCGLVALLIAAWQPRRAA